MKRTIVLVAVLACALVATAPAEAAKTSAKEGRKFSRKYLKQDSVNDSTTGTKISATGLVATGVGAYRIFPGGVACLFSADPRRGPAALHPLRHRRQGRKTAHTGRKHCDIFPYHGDRLGQLRPLGGAVPRVATALGRHYRGPVAARRLNTARQSGLPLSDEKR